MKESREETKGREGEERQRGSGEKETENSDRCIGTSTCMMEEEINHWQIYNNGREYMYICTVLVIVGYMYL